MRAWQGHTEAWFHMGVMHLNGWGTARNLQQAQYFFSMAAKVSPLSRNLFEDFPVDPSRTSAGLVAVF